MPRLSARWHICMSPLYLSYGCVLIFQLCSGGIQGGFKQDLEKGDLKQAVTRGTQQSLSIWGEITNISMFQLRNGIQGAVKRPFEEASVQGTMTLRSSKFHLLSVLIPSPPHLLLLLLNEVHTANMAFSLSQSHLDLSFQASPSIIPLYPMRSGCPPQSCSHCSNFSLLSKRQCRLIRLGSHCFSAWNPFFSARVC